MSLHTHASSSTLVLLTSLVLAGGILSTVYFLSASSAHAASCGAYSSAYTVPQGYGAAWNLFSSQKEKLLDADCATNNFSAVVPSTSAPTALYQTGYRWTGSQWEQITYTGTNAQQNGYLMGSGSTAKALAYAGDHTYFVAFICSEQNATWKCGCRDTACGQSYWQLQAAVKPSTGGTGTGSGGGGGSSTSYSCGSTNITRRWNPPALTNPLTITVTNGTTFPITIDRSRDAIVTCSNTLTSNMLRIEGGRNVVVKNCKINLNGVCSAKGVTDPNFFNWSAGIKVSSFTGSFLAFENLHVDVSDCPSDGIAIAKNINNDRSSTPFDVYVYNTVIYAGHSVTGNNPNGSQKGNHADVFHDQDDINPVGQNLYVEHTLSGSWGSGWTGYRLKNIHVRNSQVLPNDALGKTCKPVVAGYGGELSVCSAKSKVNASYQAKPNLYAYENVYAWGCAPCSGTTLVSGTITQTLNVHNMTCLSSNLQ